MSDEAWMNRYPGSWRGPLSASCPCLICKEPGYVVMAPSELPTVLDASAELTAPAFETANTCPGHEYVVRRYLAERFAPRRMAYREGRP